MVANERLRDACEAWVQASLTSLRGKQVALNAALQVVWTTEQAMTVVPIDALAASRLFADYGDVLMTLPELAALTRVVQESAQAADALLPDAETSALSPTEVAASLFRSHLGTFLIAYLKHSHASHGWQPTDVLFVPERFDHVYTQFEQFIYDPAAIEAWWVYQFGNLSTEVDVISLPLTPAFVAPLKQSEIKLSLTTVARATPGSRHPGLTLISSSPRWFSR